MLVLLLVALVVLAFELSVADGLDLLAVSLEHAVVGLVVIP